MANARQHLMISAALGATLNVVKQLVQRSFDPTRRFDWVELAAFSAIGGLFGVMPDLLEPATSPNHRAFFHSALFGAAAFYATHGRHTRRWSGEAQDVARVICYCYLSHLASDATTPKGLPII